MKIRDLFNYVHKLKEDPFKDGELLVWLNEVEGLVHTKVFLLAPSEYKEITADDIDSDTFKLLIVGPHQKIYPAYLVAMIDFANGEYNRYANTLEMFNAHFTELQMWQRQYAGPADGECVFRGYYLSAYGIAKNRGVFNGSEEEWLASLKGDKGDSAYDIAVKLGYKGTEQEWIDYLAKAQSAAIEDALKSALEDIETNCGGNLSLIDSARENALRQIAEANEELSSNLSEYHSGLNDHYSNIAAELNSFRGDSIDEIAGAKAAAIDEIESTGSIFTNALKGTASGEAIAITDASPIEHEMDVKVSNKNLIPFPYENPAGTSVTKPGGVTFTTNADGSITLNGTATGNIFYSLVTPYLELQDGKYALSGGYKDENNNRCAVCVRNPANTILASSLSSSVTFSIQEEGQIAKEFYLYAYSGSTFDNVTLYPQLEEGSTATAYTPYIEDISTVKVKKYGKNLFEAIARKEHRGITFELLDDGTYHVYGTNDGTSDSYLDHYLVLPAGKYIGSGCPQGGLNTTYRLEFFNQATSRGSVDYGNGAVFEATTTQRFTVQMLVRSGQTVDLIFKPMIEVGTGDKVYEPYIEPIEYPVSADGTVEGVTPIYPTTTLMTDTAGAVIDCTYNRDINKAFEELYNAIISTGGNV